MSRAAEITRVVSGKGATMLGANERSLDFRASDVQRVMQSIRTGKSCVLLSVDGMGKTTFLHHVCSHPVRQHYLREQYKHMHFFLLDAQELERTPLAYFRQMAFVLGHYYQELPYSAEQILAVDHETIARQILLERIETIIHQDRESVLVFCIDEFDVVLSEMNPHFLRMLQALRHRAEGRFYYVVTASNGPALLCRREQDTIVSEMFEELFDGNVWGLHALEQVDACAMIERRWPEFSTVTAGFTKTICRRLCDVTGSHPGILKSAVAAVADGNVVLREQDSEEQIIRKLLKDSAVVSKCKQFWNSLSEMEQEYLKSIRQGKFQPDNVQPPFSEHGLYEPFQALTTKGIYVRDTNGNYRCFSPLFTGYVAQQFSIGMRGIQLNPALRLVYIDGKQVSQRLSKKEFHVLEFLASEPGRVFRREETTEAIYKEKYASRRDDDRLDALIERTRRRIGDSQRYPRFLETIRGTGHRLNEYAGIKI